ncbi:putative S-methyl-5'-thioinosine phosphorylase [Balamuthia mandrillaris]
MMAAEKSKEEAPGLLGIIGGTSLLQSSYFAALERRTIATDHGEAVLHFGKGFVFVQRHHADPSDEYRPPHLINFCAVVSALHKVGVQRVISFGSVGSLHQDLQVGTLVLADDFFSAFNPQLSLYTDARSHVVPTIDADLRQTILSLLTKDAHSLQLRFLREEGTYVQTQGPRFETKAEIKVLAGYGHVVGMTAAHEVALCCELGIPIALLTMVDNYANGVATVPLTVQQFKEGVLANQKTVEAVLGCLLAHFAPAAIAAASSSSSSE